MLQRRVASLFLFMGMICVPPSFADADLAIAIEPPKVLYGGSTPAFILKVANLGPDPSDFVEVIVTASPGLAVGSCSEVTPCSQLPLWPGQDFTLVVEIGIPLFEEVFVVQARVSSSYPDPDHSNNVTEFEFELDLLPDLVASTFSSSSRVDPGSVTAFVGQIGNFAHVAANDVVLRITPLDGAEVAGPFDDRCHPAGSDLLCELGTVEGHSTTHLEFGIRVPETNDGSPLRVAVSVRSAENDLADSNNDFVSSTPTYRLSRVTAVTDDGEGSLRAAIRSANSICNDGDFCKITFQIAGDSKDGVQSIDLLTPLPEVTAENLFIDGTSQTRFGGDTNPFGPEIEILGKRLASGDGLVIHSPCEVVVSNLVINSFPGNGVVIAGDRLCDAPARPTLRRSVNENYIGTDPSGSEARPNRLRGILVEASNMYVVSNVLSGNGRSGLFVTSGGLLVSGNLIGTSADERRAIPNGASGIYVGESAIAISITGNVIAFNREFGVSLDERASSVDIGRNSIYSNGFLGIDYGLNGVTLGPKEGADGLQRLVGVPVLTSVVYDPATGRTRIEGRLAPIGDDPIGGYSVHFYANKSPDATGFGEGEEFVGVVQPTVSEPLDAFPFVFETDLDLRGRWITATTTRLENYGFKTNAMGERFPVPQGWVSPSSTSEFSRAIFVSGSRTRPVGRR